MFGPYQKIPATSNPPGAKISVDGEVKGNTPLNLHLKKTKSHVIRIEKEGYNPLEIKIRQESSSEGGWAMLGNFAAGVAVGVVLMEGLVTSWSNHDGHLFFPLFVGGMCLIGFMGFDYIGGGLYELHPAELQITLTPIEGQAKTDFIVISAERLNKIKWIRIKCSESR